MEKDERLETKIETDEKSEKSAKELASSEKDTKPKKKNMTTFSQVYRAVLALAAAVVLIFIFVSALNIYKKNNSFSKQITNKTVSDAPVDTKSDSSTEDKTESDNSTDSGTIVTCEGDGYSFNVDIPNGFTYYYFINNKDDKGIKDDSIPNEPCIVIHPGPDSDNDSYLDTNNVIIIYCPKDKFAGCGTGITEENVVYGNNKGIMGTYSDTPQAFDYITFEGDTEGIVVLNHSDWYLDYEKEINDLFSSITFTKD